MNPKLITELTEQLKVKFRTEKPIIIIGGVAGSGKTTTGNMLLHEFELDHRIGTGWIREIVASKTTQEQEPALFVHSFRPLDAITPPFEHFTSASKAILPSVEACIRRARREGQSLLIEGPMLIPGLLPEDMYDIFVCLKKPEDQQEYFRILTTGTHTKRKIYPADLPANVEIENNFLKICQSKNIPVIPFVDKERRKAMIIKAIAHHFLGV